MPPRARSNIRTARAVSLGIGRRNGNDKAVRTRRSGAGGTAAGCPAGPPGGPVRREAWPQRADTPLVCPTRSEREDLVGPAPHEDEDHDADDQDDGDDADDRPGAELALLLLFLLLG